MSALDRVVVVGAGLAGVSAVRALREQGFRGELVQVGDEPHAPYDRPPLSKEFLAGAWESDQLALTGPDDAALDVELRTGTAAAALDPAARELRLADGARLGFDGLVIATGARARTLPVQSAPGAPTRGVFTLRTLDDAAALREALVPGARLVVLGAGFLGAEAASTARSRGCDVTVVEPAAVPLADAFGEQLGRRCAALHAEHGVRLLTGARAAALIADGAGAVRAVELADGTRLPADVVLVAVGARPAVDWLADSGLRIAGGVVVDAEGRTGLDGVVAVGDCAARVIAETPVAGQHRVAGQHWTDALHAPVPAVAALLGQEPPQRPAITRLPYVWSHQYGVMIQLAGRCAPGDVLHVVQGSLDSAGFTGLLGPDPEALRAIRPDAIRPDAIRPDAIRPDAIRPGVVNAVVAMNDPRGFTRLRKALAGAAERAGANRR